MGYGEREEWLRRQREAHHRVTVERERVRAAVRREERLPKAGDVVVGPYVVVRGRPLRSRKGTTLTALKPWAGYGMARSTWYRRRKGGTLPRAKEKPGAWQASAELIAKLREEDDVS